MFVRIGELPRYERLPGEYCALQLGESTADFCKAAELLKTVGTEAVVFPGYDDRPVLHVTRPIRQWRIEYLDPGDWITFRRRRDGRGWSVITYSRKDFEGDGNSEPRYRRVEP